MLLFEELKFCDYKFPEPQYLGAKYLFRHWIEQFIDRERVHAVLDAFGGSQSISYFFKQNGFQTLTNDFLNFNHQIGLALVENKSEKLTQEDVEILFSGNQDPSYFNLFEETFTNIFFEHSETVFLDAFRSNIERLANRYKKALAFAVMNRSMTRKVTMGHFAHTRALEYAANPERVRRNRSLVRPLKELFLDLIPAYNQAVFDNYHENRSFCENTLDLLPRLSDVDLVYFDPPYCGSHADYQGFYHVLETFTEYWKDKQFVNGTRRYEPKKYSGFEHKSEILFSLERLFEQAEKIPFWFISYNDRSFPDEETLVALVARFRKVKIARKPYISGRGGKGSVAGSHEILIIGEKNDF